MGSVHEFDREEAVVVCGGVGSQVLGGDNDDDRGSGKG